MDGLRGGFMTKGNATIYDVADVAFVSIATVSRVINGGSHVRPETRDRVDAAIKQLNFIPSSAARSLSGGKKWSIGLAYPLYENRVAFSPSREEDSNVLFTDTIIRGASTQAAQLGYSLFACAVRIGHDEGMVPLQQLSSSVDGVILVDRVVNDVGAMRIAKRMRAVHLSGSGATKFGATVKIVDEATDEERKYMIVGDAEADASKGRISISSPIARAMIGKSAGDVFEVTAPGGARSYEILELKYV